MVQGQTKYICSPPIHSSSKDCKDADMRKSNAPWTNKDQQAAARVPVKSYASGNAHQNPWGKVFKSEQHFKSMHICWSYECSISSSDRENCVKLEL